MRPPRAPAILVAMMSLLSFVLLLIGCSPGVCPSPEVTPKPSSSGATSSCTRGHTAIIVRHAEKASPTEKDPPLSDRGHARARAIASLFANTGVTRLVATQYQRTQQTLAPLAERLHTTVDVRQADRSTELVKELREAPDGAVIVVASHSNVIPRLVRELANAQLRGVEGDMLPDDDYARIVIVTQPCHGVPTIVELSSNVRATEDG